MYDLTITAEVLLEFFRESERILRDNPLTPEEIAMATEACPHACGGTLHVATDELGCGFMECGNYPTCDYQVYTAEQSMANTRAYALANPEWRAEFIRKRGREPGVWREGPHNK